MAEAFESARGPLAERLLAALAAAQAEGGDLRVEDHPRPLDGLARLLVVHRCYELMNRGDLALGARSRARP